MELQAKNLLPHFYSAVCKFLNIGYEFVNGNHYFNGLMHNGKLALKYISKAAYELGYTTYLNDNENTFTIYAVDVKCAVTESYREFECESVEYCDCEVKYKCFLYPCESWEESEFLDAMHNADFNLKCEDVWVEIKAELISECAKYGVEFYEDNLNIYEL